MTPEATIALVFSAITIAGNFAYAGIQIGIWIKDKK